MAIARKVNDFMAKASWIRKMFEEGIRMKQEVGAEKVFDFSLGNPILEPPEAFLTVLKKMINDSPAGLHRYMGNAGHVWVREKVAAYLQTDTGATLRQ